MFMYKIDSKVRNVLLVEDNMLTMLLLESEFSKHGFKVFKASDGLAGWKLCQKQHFELIIIDLLMPLLDGKELMQKIREELPKPQGPVYATSAGLSKSEIDDLAKWGFKGYLQKPVKLVSKGEQSYMKGQE